MSSKTNMQQEKSAFGRLIESYGLPRFIITLFLLLLLILAPIVGADLPTQITNIIARFSWNGVLVLAMVPMVHSGCGLNFGLPLGIISGLLGATTSSSPRAILRSGTSLNGAITSWRASWPLRICRRTTVRFPLS